METPLTYVAIGQLRNGEIWMFRQEANGFVPHHRITQLIEGNGLIIKKTIEEGDRDGGNDFYEGRSFADDKVS